MSHLFSTNADNKRIPSGYHYKTHSYRNEHVLVDAFNAALHDPNQIVYVGYGAEFKARYGSIGIAVPKGYDPKNRSKWPAARVDPVTTSSGTRRYYDDYVSIDEMDIYWDSKHLLSTDRYESDLYWLTSYVGETKWVFTRKTKVEREKVVAYDKLENEVVVGDFVAFVGRRTYGTGKGDLMFGFVEKVSPAGIMTCKNIKLSDTDHVQEWRVAKGDQITKMTADILKQLMLRRLTF